jgi:hypothetical protein
VELRARIWCVVVVVAVLGPNVWAIAGSHQCWPWDSGPMFAFTIDENARVYRFRVTLEPQEMPLPPKALGLDERALLRHMFAHVYGSVDERFPDHHMVDDDPAAFTARMTSWCDSVVDEMKQKGKLAEGTTAIRVAVEVVDEPGSPPHVVGRYDLASRRFAHLWQR